jgi:NAD(P)-dependent dehydrogenase (short-subunit alcohol dehydrogenase family)
LGQLDILVVNAGILDLRPLDKWDETAFNRSFAFNIKGPFFLIQALLPVFSNPASIVLTTSINANVGMPNSSIYGACNHPAAHGRRLGKCKDTLGLAQFLTVAGIRISVRSSRVRSLWQATTPV